MRAGRSPQDDKRLSYARDRRNDYGEHDKSSRKNIARSKKTPNRANLRLERIQASSGLDIVAGQRWRRGWH